MKPSSIPENYNSASSPPSTNWDVFFFEKGSSCFHKKERVCVFSSSTLLMVQKSG